MSQPLTDQRQRAELLAELYDRHAAGLFAYVSDQLGDLGSASDVLVALFSSVAGLPSPAEAPRAALYAFARREIHRRDIVYAPHTVDPLIDPATALVERTLRELRPHQREVLVLCGVCGLSASELAWVLDVAPDTAEELTVGAGHHFRQALGTALASTGLRVPKPVADVYGALGVAPLRDVLGRLPWPQPPGALRIHFAGSRSAAPGPLFVKPRWPSPPIWPQPPADADPATSTVLFPAELLTPPAASQVSRHEATTAPMPKLRDPLDSSTPALRDPLALRDSVPLRDPSALPDPLGFRDPLTSRDPLALRDPLGALEGSRAPGSPPHEQPFFLAKPEPTGLEPFATGDVILPRDTKEPFATGDVLLPPRPSARAPLTSRDPHVDVLVHKGPARQVPAVEDEPRLDAAPLFRPRPKSAGRPEPSRPADPPRSTEPPRTAEPPRFPEPVRAARPAPATESVAPAEPIYRLPSHGATPSTGPATAAERKDSPRTSTAPAESSLLAPRPVRTRPTSKKRPEYRARPEKARRRNDRHHDWIWEAVGFLICVAIAMIVFFSVPMFVHP
ncbi:hypothetical protein FH608_021265 [Nonomuraea phyllanthi]|uniref:RNA polymerase sigma factor 70 region 4 type 2 domain-containing protein n=1 Tax=Nonomuraea phyllanthi TaxID=2219224 RepID=A0A5C4WFU7_9ACTN|nr:sigma-70 family RNA polymerase sigma factor [Nonomuraea phyllanthi]KAB8193736.1 hypothetical protein FH608_021265 [Nonomuraea phyllanthi]